MLKKDSKICLRPLFFGEKGEDGLYPVVRPDTGVELKLSKQGILFCSQLLGGKSLDEAGIEADVSLRGAHHLIQTLLNAGFIKSIDDFEIKDIDEKISPLGAFWKRNRFYFLRTKWFGIMVLSIVIVGLSFGFLSGYFPPNYDHYFWIVDPFVAYTGIFFLRGLLSLGHELVHFATTKAVGGEAKISLGMRGFYLVAETESYYLDLLPKKFRYFVYLSGMVFNLLIMAICYFMMINLFPSEISWLRQLLLLLAFMSFQGFIWQTNFYLRTDLYNVLCEFWNNNNLHTNTLAYVSHCLKRNKSLWARVLVIFFNLLFDAKKIQRDSDNLSNLNSVEMRQIKIYTTCFILGSGLVLLQAIIWIMPMEMTFLFHGGFMISRAQSVLELFSGILLILMILWKYMAISALFFSSKFVTLK